MNKQYSHTILRVIQPLFILAGIGLFALGAGIARYLGTGIDWSIYLLGQGYVTALQISTGFLREYYKPLPVREKPNPDHQVDPSKDLEITVVMRRSLFIAAFACLAIAASLAMVIISQVQPTPTAYIIMLVGFLAAFFYYAPPFTLDTSGYGELVHAFAVAFLIPIFSYILLTGEFHRLTAIIAFSETFLYLAMLIALELPVYGRDVSQLRSTLLVRMGWQNAMTVHNMLILSAFLLLGLAAFFGLPSFVGLASLIPLPIGLLEIWQVWRINQGEKPSWSSLRLNALALVGVMIYVLTYAFWTR
jgi:1,4-dihydroxy-2-naphthoate octaprenyltransferase